MTLLIILLLLAVVLYNWPRIQAWLVMKLVQRIGRRMAETAGAGQAGESSRSQSSGYRSSQRERSYEDMSSELRQQHELDDIERRKFEHSSRDEYVDFEELPK